MTYVSQKFSVWWFGCLLACLLLGPSFVSAQQSLSLSVTPTLFEVDTERGQRWESEIRIINSNPYPITVYTDVVNFAPTGERGQGEFVPTIADRAGSSTLAGWLTLPDEPITIARETSVQVPFSVRVPDTAPPGGHFAAILVGTQPPTTANEQLSVATSQVVSSLVFMRVAGAVVESGLIRSFTVAETFREEPTATFSLRFENRGNVHIQPQGEIVIKNMWGRERGRIPINQNSQFGNVLPDSIREYDFTWRGQSALSDMGRYTAEVTLAYGTKDRQFDSRTVSFWIVPITELVLGGLLIGGLLMLGTWSIHMYVQRALKRAGLSPAVTQPKGARNLSLASYRDVRQTSVRPSPLGRSRQAAGSNRTGRTRRLVRNPYLLLAGAVGVTLLIITTVYVLSALTPSRNYEVTLERPAETETISSEEIIYNELRSTRPPSTATTTRSQLHITNVSGVPGTGAELALMLADAGYQIASIDSDLERIQERTVILFPPAERNAALTLSQTIGSALLSARSGSSTTESATRTPLHILVGADSLDITSYTD